MRKKQFTEYVPLNSLTVNERVQRGIIPARVKKLMNEWDFRSVGVITVSRRDGKNYIVDGQHRWDAGLKLGHGTSRVLCHIYTDLSEQEEAALFISLNDSRVVAAIDKFRVGLVAGNHTCQGVDAILKKHGLQIGVATSDGIVRCVNKAMNLYDKDPDLLDAVCFILKESWGTRPAAFEAVVFAAMGTVMDRYNGGIDRGAFVKKLSGYRGGPAALAGDARGLADFKPITVTRAAAEIMVDIYNKGRRGGKLAPL